MCHLRCFGIWARLDLNFVLTAINRNMRHEYHFAAVCGSIRDINFVGSVFNIRRGKWDNLAIIFRNTPLKCYVVTPN